MGNYQCVSCFFLRRIVGFFPDTAYYYGSALLVPGSIAVILLAIRGSFYAFENYGSKENSVYLFLYGATGLLIPASLSVALTLSEGGFIVEEGGAVTLEYLKLISSPLSWIIVALAIVSVLFISSAFLTFYASRADDQPALKLVRTYALFWGTPTIIAALTAFIYLSQHNERHFQNMMDLWWLLALSVGFFMIAMWLLYTGRRYGLAFICVMLQFFSAFFLLMASGSILIFWTRTLPFRAGLRKSQWALRLSLPLSAAFAADSVSHSCVQAIPV